MSEATKQKTKAVIELSGHQYVVAVGEKVALNKLDKAEGETFVTTDLLDGIGVELKVIRHFLGKKIRGLKFKNKIRFIRRYGHRQDLTELEVVSLGAKKPAAETKTATPSKENK
jgi:large subunit ribosomal protein L21